MTVSCNECGFSVPVENLTGLKLEDTDFELKCANPKCPGVEVE